jgi:hypothetical protein
MATTILTLLTLLVSLVGLSLSAIILAGDQASINK